MEKRVALYFNTEKNEKDKAIVELLSKAYSEAGFIKDMLYKLTLKNTNSVATDILSNNTLTLSNTNSVTETNNGIEDTDINNSNSNGIAPNDTDSVDKELMNNLTAFNFD